MTVADRNPVLHVISLSFVAGAAWLAAAPAAAQGTALEEIIVTAQKREQRLQDVPISVATLGGDQLLEQNMVELEALGALLPNVHVSEAAIGDKLFIRGVGSGINAGFEQSVGTFIDGVYHGRSLQSRSQFLDVERVEVLRGPQSTFFGNNTIGGALNVVTRAPSDEFTGHVSGLYEFEHDEYHVEAAAGGPASDTLSLRGAILFSGLDGWLENANTGDEEPDEDNIAGRLRATWEPVANFRAMGKIEYGTFEVEGRALQNLNCPPATGAGGVCAITTLPVLAAFGPAFAAPLYPAFDDELDDTTQANGPVPAGFLTAINTLGALEAGTAIPAPDSRYSTPDLAELTTRNYTLTMEFDVGDHVLTSVTGYSAYDFDFRQQSDFVPIPIASVGQEEDFEQFSQELRVTSPTGGVLEYLGGIYYQTSDLDVDEDISLYFPPPYFQPFASWAMAMDPMRLPATFALVDSAHEQDEETFAVFASVTWNITEDLRVTAGARYTNVDKDLDRAQAITDLAPGITVPCVIPIPAVCPSAAAPLLVTAPNSPPFNAFGWGAGALSLAREDDDFTPSVSVQWNVTGDAMLYFSFAQGFKAGGFDQRNLFLDPVSGQFEPESVDAYEIGAKTVFLDDMLNINVALFRSEYDDLQVSTFDGVVNFLVNNAASAVTQGVELDARMRFSERFFIAASAAYLDADWDDFQNAQCTALDLQRARLTGPHAGCAPNADGLFVQDLTGRDLIMSPKWSGNVFAEYIHPVTASLDVIGQLSVYFEGDHYLAADNDPTTIQESFAKLDFRLALAAEQGWEVALVARNLTDKLTSGHIEDQPLQSVNSFFALTERPRTIALQASYQW
jgi:outer membrane receptor protein involved in Fe transport